MQLLLLRMSCNGTMPKGVNREDDDLKNYFEDSAARPFAVTVSDYFPQA